MKIWNMAAVLGAAVFAGAGAFAQGAAPSEDIAVKKLAENFYSIEDPSSRQFFVVGSDKVLLFDTGIGRYDPAEKVRTVSDLPIEVAITHGHPDHIGGIKYFGECFISEQDAALLPQGVTAHVIKAGDTLTCGDFSFEVVDLAGHTAGSVAFLEQNRRFMVGGDSIQPGPIFMLGEKPDIDTYIKTLKALKKKAKQIDRIYPAHNADVVGREYIDWCIADATAFKKGKLQAVKELTMMGQTHKVYQGKHVSFLAD